MYLHKKLSLYLLLKILVKGYIIIVEMYVREGISDPVNYIYS